MRALNPVVRADVGSRHAGHRPAPRKPRVVHVRLQLRHARRSRLLVNDIRPLGDHIQQHRALLLIHARILQALRLNRLALGTACFRWLPSSAFNRAIPLSLSAPRGRNRLAVLRIERGLRTRERRRQRAFRHRS
jgi:hypothetical protein